MTNNGDRVPFEFLQLCVKHNYFLLFFFFCSFAMEMCHQVPLINLFSAAAAAASYLRCRRVALRVYVRSRTNAIYVRK